jgi:hypothetical protein
MKIISKRQAMDIRSVPVLASLGKDSQNTLDIRNFTTVVMADAPGVKRCRLLSMDGYKKRKG